MLTLSKGFKKPQTGDKGSVFFPALEANWQQVNDHTHNGTNSQLIAPTAITAVSQSLLAASWSLVSPGVYRILVTMPAGITWANNIWKYINTASNAELLLPTERNDTNKFYIYSNDNTINVDIIYR